MPLRITQFRKWLRSLVLLALSILFFLYSDLQVWLLFLLLALFFFGVDVMHIDESESSGADPTEEYSSHKLGVLDHYIIDSDKCYALFISLNGKHILVDIREDKFIDERKKFARHLFDNSARLEKHLNEFIASHSEYSSSQIATIGLHSKVLDQGEVFWYPDGYTTLKGLEFLP